MKLKLSFIFAGLALLLVVSFLTALSYGSAALPLKEIIAVLAQGLQNGLPPEDGDQGPVYDIIWLLRMPRIILAMCVGTGLSVAGVIMQAIVKNPLADPYILGISSGASLGATAAILLGAGAFLGENFIGLAAFAGAFATSLLVLIIANLGGQANAVKLILSGMALNAVCSAFASFIIYFANNIEGMQTISYWLMGSLANASWKTLATLVPIVLLGVIFFWSQRNILNIMLLGDEAAVTLGYDLQKYRQLYLLLSSFIVGFVVYAAGMIGFVGLIIPHIIRMLAGSNHTRLIPLAAVAGAIFLILADLGCRIIIPRTELPIGILISLIGAPAFIYLMVKRTYGFGGK